MTWRGPRNGGRRFAKPKPSITCDIPAGADAALAEVLATYNGSDGDRTKALYARLEQRGPIGQIAVNLFRAQKASARAKVYRGGDKGGRYRDQAYQRKQWSIDNLATILIQHADVVGITWGWAEDPAQEYHKVVLYIDLPTGQASFHTERRGQGPAYASSWDGRRGETVGRICRFVACYLDCPNVTAADCFRCRADTAPIVTTDGLQPGGTLNVHTFCGIEHATQAGFSWAGRSERLQALPGHVRSVAADPQAVEAALTSLATKPVTKVTAHRPQSTGLGSPSVRRRAEQQANQILAVAARSGR